MKYFAYGSNLLSARLLARVDARSLGMARLAGYALHWNYHSLDGSGKCNIEPSTEPGAVVFGALYEMDDEAFAVLDRFERGYDRIRVMLDHRGDEAEAWTYVYAEAAPEAAPYLWYKGLVVAGAIEHGFPEEAVERLRQVVAASDPMPDRTGRLHAEELLKKAGYTPR